MAVSAYGSLTPDATLGGTQLKTEATSLEIWREGETVRRETIHFNPNLKHRIPSLASLFYHPVPKQQVSCLEMVFT